MDFREWLFVALFKDKKEQYEDTIYSRDLKIRELEDEIEKLKKIPEDEKEKQELIDSLNNKYPKKVIYYTGRNIPNVGNLNLDVRGFYINPECAELKKISSKWKHLPDDQKAFKCLEWVIDNIKYTPDKEQYGLNEFWGYPQETLNTKKGDCIANYEEIYTKNGIKKVGDLKVGDLVLSYDFETKEYCYKPITKIWEKGKLKINRVHLRNGTFVDISEKHPLWVRTLQKHSKYEKTYLKDIDLTRWWKRKLPCAKKLPYEIKDIKWLREDLCIVLGHFLAEGWIYRNQVSTSGYELNGTIIPILERNEIPFTEYVNNSGVPCLDFLKSDFKEFLKEFKGEQSLSFSAHIPEKYLHLPEKKLKAILKGYFIGDGHKITYEDTRGYNSNEKFVYSTSSEQLAKDIQQIHLQLGEPVYVYKQLDHQGFGKHPIYRISYNPNSCFSRDYGYDGLSEVSISYIKELEETEMRDFEVKDTHTFFFRNGLCSHQCDDGAILLANLMEVCGVPYWKIRLTAGMTPSGGHAYVTYYRESDGTWVNLDWCYYPTRKSIKARPNYKKEKHYGDVWFSWNRLYSFSKGVK